MKIIVALDDKDGMMFNKRRQSQDRVLRERVFKLTEGSALWMNEYSKKQFEADENAADFVHNICTDEAFLQKASAGEYCFVESDSLVLVKEQIEEIVIFRWNRRYPGDKFLDVRPQDLGFDCKSVEEFAGSSHEKITMEIWG